MTPVRHEFEISPLLSRQISTQLRQDDTIDCQGRSVDSFGKLTNSQDLDFAASVLPPCACSSALRFVSGLPPLPSPFLPSASGVGARSWALCAEKCLQHIVPRGQGQTSTEICSNDVGEAQLGRLCFFNQLGTPLAAATVLNALRHLIRPSDKYSEGLARLLSAGQPRQKFGASLEVCSRNTLGAFSDAFPTPDASCVRIWAPKCGHGQLRPILDDVGEHFPSLPICLQTSLTFG